jgi:DNA modification methylase
MSGSGKIALIRNYGYIGRITCNDLEPEWTNPDYPVDEWHYTDAAVMDWARDEQFDVIATSPTYGNRMADHFTPKDSSKRYSYTINLGRELSEGNTGTMQWGLDYQQKNAEIAKECYRVLQSLGVFVLNVSDHVRNYQVVNVVGWWVEMMIETGFNFINEIEVETPRMRNGANFGARVESESICVFRKASN